MSEIWGFLRTLGTRHSSRVLGWLGMGALALTQPLIAAQVDISGPLGSVAFGTSVTVLPNGNFVVTDPDGPVSDIGAVYLYSPSGMLISTLTGSSANDHVGSDRVVVVGGGNFVIRSPSWNNVGASGAGAVTWVNGSTGLTGVVSASNSLVGTTTGDYVGYPGVTALSNGNYVVATASWNNGTANSNFGAVTWGNGSSGITGPVSASNSLIGTTTGDNVGGYGVTALSNGNYVVATASWNNGTANSNFGAVTWGNGSSGIAGPVSASNSLIGTTTGDKVGIPSVTALSNGNYVVASSNWNNGVANSHFGAATWGNGSSGIMGAVSASNSLIGTTPGDLVCSSATALSNGNYVVASLYWNNGTANSAFGAATWGDGSSGIAGPVSASNSLIGTTTGDSVGTSGVTALSNGNYVVRSVYWNNGTANSNFGAATWGKGSGGTTGPVSGSNSLIGTTTGDYVGYPGVTALSNGNYVVRSPNWNNGTANSNFGAVTWSNGSGSTTGPVSRFNSLIGTTTGDKVGSSRVTALSNGNYVVASFNWNGSLGAVTLASGGFRSKGTIQSGNSVLGTAANAGSSMSYGYDPVRLKLIVGRPASNIVSVFTMDQIFAGDFEP